MKGNFKKGLKIYKMSSKALDLQVESSYINIENKKIPLKCKLEIHLNKPVKMHVSTINFNDSFYNNISFEITSNIIPEKAIKSPITEERIKSQIMKTTNTPYKFVEIEIDMDDNLYIPHIADINNLRRTCIEKLENIILGNYCNKHINFHYPNVEKFNSNENLYANTPFPKISVLLNKLDLAYNYSLLQNIDNIYIPLKYFINSKYFEILHTFAEKFNLYIYLPTIMRSYYINMLSKNIKKILSTYKIEGFVISNLGNLDFVSKLLKENKIANSYKYIGNYTLNVFNNQSISELSKLNLSTITISPELNESDFNNLQKNFCSEIIVYGKIPIMNINYCPLSKKDKCLSNCTKYCMSSNNYYLTDRLGFKFEIIPDFGDCTTTIYNSKTLSIDPTLSATSIRLDFIHEDISEINSIISQIKSSKKLEGSEFTNGNWHREI